MDIDKLLEVLQNRAEERKIFVRDRSADTYIEIVRVSVDADGDIIIDIEEDI